MSTYIYHLSLPPRPLPLLTHSRSLTQAGDYFGFLMPARVTGFPFNVLSDPMYVGTTLNFFGHAVVHRSPAGLVLAAAVGLAYVVALRFEGPFTDHIYAEAARKKAASKKQ